MNSSIPLSLYVHLPWCIRKCPYCDFNSHTAGEAAPRNRYVRALLDDLRQEAASGRADGRTIDTVFLGGGTPSLFDGDEILRIVDGIRGNFSLAPDAEITMEANPGTTEYDKLENYRQAGVNRISLGAQSFDDAMLARLGRIHDSAEIHTAFDDAVSAGFDNINLDLMYALPGQSVAGVCSDLDAAVSLGPTHVSWYQLTLEPNTVFFARPPAGLPDEDESFRIHEAGQAALAAAGYEQYEISAFAKPGFRCRHNLNYWRFGDYLAVGAGAHGKFTDADGSVWRYRKPAHPTSFMEQAGCADADVQLVNERELGFEFMLNALRLPDGFSEDRFSERTGLDFTALVDGIERARTLQLLSSPTTGRWQPTARGLRFLNDLQSLFLPGEDAG